MRRGFVALVVLVVVSIAAQDARGVVLYTIADLGTLGGTESEAFGINDGRQVAGWADASGNDRHAFLYKPWGATVGLPNRVACTAGRASSGTHLHKSAVLER